MVSRQDRLNWLMSQKFLDAIAIVILFIFAFSIFLLYGGWISFNIYSYILLFVFLIVVGKLSQEKFFVFSKLIFLFFLLLMGFLIFLSWWGGNTFFGQSIDDMRMMVIVTMTYVFTTCWLVTSQNYNFKQSRLPTLSFDVRNNFDFCIENSSKYIAREPKVRVQVNFPLLECLNPLSALYWHWVVKKNVFNLDYPDVFPYNHGNYIRFKNIKSNLEKYLLRKNIRGAVKFDIVISYAYECDDIEGVQKYFMRLPIRIKVNRNKMELLS